jgi:hypothetical protein
MDTVVDVFTGSTLTTVMSILNSAYAITNIEQAREQKRSIRERKELKTSSFEFISDKQLDPERL